MEIYEKLPFFPASIVPPYAAGNKVLFSIPVAGGQGFGSWFFFHHQPKPIPVKIMEMLVL
jgi:hypothetical protein